MTTLGEYRKAIDSIDETLVEMISTRVRFARLAARSRGGGIDEDREREIVERLTERAQDSLAGTLGRRDVERIWTSIFRTVTNDG